MKIKNTDFSAIITDEALQRAAWGGDCADPARSNKRCLKKIGDNIVALSEEEIVRIFQNIGAGDTHRSLRKILLRSICHYVLRNRDEPTKSVEQIERIMMACSGAFESIYVQKNGQSEGRVKAHLSMARMYLKEGNENRGMALLQPLVDQDNSTAQRILALYLLHKNRGSDRGRALELLKQASTHGDVPAMNALAHEYVGKIIWSVKGRLRGFSGTKIEEGIQFFMRSAALGEPRSRFVLAHMRLSGVGVPQDIREGLRLLSSLPEDFKGYYEIEDLCFSDFRARS